MKFGSHLYGTNTLNSDLDIKGVFLPSKEQVLLGRIPKTFRQSTGDSHSKNTENDIDIELFSLHYFLKIACEGQTIAIDMLHAPHTMIFETSPIWDEIVKNRSKFYTKNLNAFVGYARRQASKYGIRGSRLNTAKEFLDILKKHKPENRLKEVWSILPLTDHSRIVPPTPNGIRQYQICGKIIQETVTIQHAINIMAKYYHEYGHRAKLAAENKGIDWKAVSHAIRAAMQIKELLLTGTIEFPLKSRELLKEIKTGQHDYSTFVAPLLEDLMKETETLSAQSKLPDKADYEFWDAWLIDILDNFYILG